MLRDQSRTEQQPESQGQVLQVPSRRFSKLKILTTLILVFGGGLFVGRYLIPAGELQYGQLQFVAVEEGERQVVFPTFWEAWDGLHNNFIGELEDENLFYGAVAGMVRATNDPYTVFSPPAETKQFEETIGGSFAGIGIEIGARNGAVTVIAPLEGTPADLAGVETGDIILAVDDTPITQEMSLDEVVRMIRGVRGNEVKLTVVHEGASEPEDIIIVRDTIEIESVKTTIEDGIALVEITNFNGDTAARFTAAARDIARSDAQGVILDVRSNPGGFLDSAVDIASRFLPKGQLVVSEQGKEGQEYTAEGSTILEDMPVVVLVDGGSASASEILAGALHDQIQAPVVGTKTFGKGSVQEFLKLSDGSSLRVTIARWFTPSGRSIDEEGIEPNITIEDNPDTEEDEQLDRAREELRNLIGG